MGFFSKLFKKKNKKFEINKKNEDNLVVMLCPKEKIKLNFKIIIPENFCAVVLSKEKLLDEIPCGEFELNGLTCPKACKINKLDKPTKKGYKTEFNGDFYFVNLKENVLKDTFFIKKTKNQVDFSIKFKIEKPKLFLEFLICEQICFENNFAQNEFNFYVKQLIFYFVLDNKMISYEKLNEHLKTKLEKIGVMLCGFDFKLSLFDKDGNAKTKISSNTDENNNKMEVIEKKDNFENSYDLDYSAKLDETLLKDNITICEKENFENKFENQVFENDLNKKTDRISGREFSKKSIVDLDDVKTQKLNYFVCDNCGAKLFENSKKCFVCGKSFVEKNLCENCGKEISKSDYVCPHCGSVVIQ